ncbi:MAG: methylated-DNA--[protein]-cysteine S-methyltransferase [Synergistaceae bacterium]|jgi:methylated-DNA-[protein]-cysteine S-methyltransferase|nr:methylated-DNA--[protein]-cysteine S-methyltransferase [Synergistaceae bacterium]
MKNVFHYNFPIGRVGIAEKDGAISLVFLEGREDVSGYEPSETPLIKEAARQLGEYFAEKRTAFDLTLSLTGTGFQVSVWNALLTIEYGETRSYKDIAVQIGNPKAARAVGSANHRNPIAIIVPCHRVIGHDGSLTGYGGGLHVKQFLLDLEKREPAVEA